MSDPEYMLAALQEHIIFKILLMFGPAIAVVIVYLDGRMYTN